MAVKSAEELQTKYIEMNEFEFALQKQGYKLIAGVDEAGRGPLAGPVVAGAAILPEDFYLPGLNDSKKLSAKKRAQFFDYIQENALAMGVGIVDADEIDKINIYEASKVAMKRAIEDLSINPDFLLIDAMKLDLDIPQENLIKGDARSNSIAAASVIAKETRDQIMQEYGAKYPGYGFEKHMGYGTKAHKEAIDRLGPTPIHRMTFAPLKTRTIQTSFEL